MFGELLQAFLLIFVAEMGDKTQILAMTFATRYPVKKVLLGIFIGAFLNHGLAVMLGTALSKVIPIQTIQIIAGVAFLLFSLWSLRDEGDEDEAEGKRIRFGPVLTVAAAFFIGELGDKTQLAAITLSTTAHYPVFILCGTVLGMIATGGIGIFIGKKIGDRVPDFAIKLASSFIFLIFGTLKLYQSVPTEWMTLQNTLIAVAVIGLPYVYLLRGHFKRIRGGEPTLYAKRAQMLYDYYHTMEEKLDSLCNNCDVCLGKGCVLGYSKTLVKEGIHDADCPLAEVNIDSLTHQTHDEKQLAETLALTNAVLNDPGMAHHPARQNIVQIQTGLSQLIETASHSEKKSD
jgi:putative Ca2+/H+ antiporter (TMEM165/GDT1 family)